MKEFFKHLLDVLFAFPPKKNCPYCGAGKCFGLCGMSDGPTAGRTEPQKKDSALAVKTKRLYDEVGGSAGGGRPGSDRG